MTANTLLNTYIDANIVLISVALIWWLAKHVMTRTPLQISYLSQLKMLYGVIFTVLLSPFVVLCVEAFQQIGLFSGRSLNLTDFLVAQYLDGNIAMAPTKFEQLLMLRADLTEDIVSFSSWGAVALVAIFLSGFIFAAGRNVRNMVSVAHMVQRSYVLRRTERVDIRFTQETRVPFSTRGLFRHYIVLPTALLAEANDARIAVAHEIQHVRQGDLFWEIGLELLRPIFFWNPAFSYCKREVERMRELACDQQVMARGTHGVRDYCECLLRVCKSGLAAHQSRYVIAPSVPFVHVDSHTRATHSVSFLKLRVISLLEAKRSSTHRLASTILMCSLLIVIFSTTVALRPVNDWSQDRLMLSTIVNLERLNTRNGTN